LASAKNADGQLTANEQENSKHGLITTIRRHVELHTHVTQPNTLLWLNDWQSSTQSFVTLGDRRLARTTNRNCKVLGLTEQIDCDNNCHTKCNFASKQQIKTTKKRMAAN
jgi:hypothetical protein